ncbi:MAG: c-type cytochrome [Flavobacteriales bacterium]|nr:c-type cytochrome [Flavobacteriales bacterium]
MPRQSRFSFRSPGLFHALFVLALTLTAAPSLAQPADAALYATGEKVFKGNCASCHKPDKDMTGPALKGARARWEGKGDIYAWVRNSTDVIKSGNPYANELFAKWNKALMTPMAVSNEEIDAVLYYADNYAPAAAKAPAAGTPAPAGEPQEVSFWPWVLVIGLLLLVVALSLGGVRKSLNNAVREAEGKGPLPDRTAWQGFKNWVWHNKVFASVLGLLLLTWGITAAWDWALTIGVYGGDTVAHYKPEQPIRFDHTLHAGKADKGNLAINCQYCHSGAEKSKHAGIPSANVCMNCHQAVTESQRNPWSNAEIKKIHEATGWDGMAYTGTPKPIQWVKVHNLPDLAFFSHEQHVAVGKLECQECHGPIDEQMDQAEQWAPLTMGWCIQCHKDKEVKMAGNGYYDEIMARLEKDEKLGHRELKQYLEDEKITVKELGGWECAKCHY